jgi:predicted nucleic acid-binding protein
MNTWRKNTLAEGIPTKPYRVLIDLNVILDVLMHREPFWEDAAKVWALAETRQVTAFVAGHSITTLFYLYRRQSGSTAAVQLIRQLLQVFSVATVDQNAIELACNLGWNDFEDAVQFTSGQGMDCKFLVTRNPQDFSTAMITVLRPSEFLAIWAAQ